MDALAGILKVFYNDLTRSFTRFLQCLYKVFTRFKSANLDLGAGNLPEREKENLVVYLRAGIRAPD